MCEIRLAEPKNAAEIMSLYRSLIGMKGLTWSDDYPRIDDVERDITEKSLYIAVSDGEIIAALCYLAFVAIQRFNRPRLLKFIERKAQNV